MRKAAILKNCELRKEKFRIVYLACNAISSEKRFF